MASDDALIDEADLARTYDEYDDPWEAVQQYREVTTYYRTNPNESAAGIAEKLGVPAGRVQGWINQNSRPNAIRGIHTALYYGWLNVGYTDRQFSGLNCLVAWLFANGHLAESGYVPSFTLRGEETRHLLTAAFDDLGTDFELANEHTARAATKGSVLGRILSLLGAPLGREPTDVSLPSYLRPAPQEVQRDFIKVYLIVSDGVDWESDADIVLRQAYPLKFVREVASFVERVSGERGVEVSGREIHIPSDVVAPFTAGSEARTLQHE